MTLIKLKKLPLISLIRRRHRLVSKIVKSQSHVVIIWLGLSLLHLLSLLLIVYLPVLRDSSFTAFGTTTVIVPYLLHSVGLPVLINDSLSGWALPSPNILGWSLSVLFWLVFYYFIAKFITQLLAQHKRDL
jgi:hypothetical protein